MKPVDVCVITGFGINADVELCGAFNHVGARAERIHLTDLIADPNLLTNYRIVAFPGGFSFGDHLGSGLVFASRFKHHLSDSFADFIESGGFAIGICNGFQILTKMGVLPNLSGAAKPEVSLIHNASGRFEDSWVDVSFGSSRCQWTSGLDGMTIPIRNGEGRFVAKDEETLNAVESKELVAVRYEGRNPNGSINNIAGITDLSGRILGLMPHPEAFLNVENHPRWTREPIQRAYGLDVLENGVRRAADA